MTERTIDAHERFAAEALLLRALHAYQEARQRAQEVGGDLSIAPELPVSGFEELASRYDELLYHWADEQPKTAAAVEPVLDLAAIITAHVARSRFVEESLIFSEERDLGYLLQLIDGARNWTVHRNVDEYMDEHVRPLGELRERCEALAAEYDAPLPEGDAGLVAAIARVHELEAREKVLHREFNITMEVEKEVFNPVIEPARDRLIDRILDTAPVGREGAVAKLRYIADARRCYINEEMEEPLAQVLSAFEREARR